MITPEIGSLADIDIARFPNLVAVMASAGVKWEDVKKEMSSMLREELAALNNETVVRVPVATLESLKRGHHYSEDCWYSCPLSDEGCSNSDIPKECNCGAEKHNEKIDELINSA